jgi:hypothetical protein
MRGALLNSVNYVSGPGFVSPAYLLKYLRRGLRAISPSIILCVNKWTNPSPQRRGILACGEGQKPISPATVEEGGKNEL